MHLLNHGVQLSVIHQCEAQHTFVRSIVRAHKNPVTGTASSMPLLRSRVLHQLPWAKAPTESLMPPARCWSSTAGPTTRPTHIANEDSRDVAARLPGRVPASSSMRSKSKQRRHVFSRHFFRAAARHVGSVDQAGDGGGLDEPRQANTVRRVQGGDLDVRETVQPQTGYTSWAAASSRRWCPAPIGTPTGLWVQWLGSSTPSSRAVRRSRGRVAAWSELSPTAPRSSSQRTGRTRPSQAEER